MGFLDNLQEGLNRGVEGAGRATRKMQISSSLKDLSKNRDSLCAQLGASLYEETRNNSDFFDTRKDLYNAIAELDSQKELLIAEINSIDAESQAVAAARATIICPVCGKANLATDSFCTGCGNAVIPPMQTIESYPEPAPVFCAECGTRINATDAFCNNCGTPKEA